MINRESFDWRDYIRIGHSTDPKDRSYVSPESSKEIARTLNELARIPAARRIMMDAARQSSNGYVTILQIDGEPSNSMVGEGIMAINIGTHQYLYPDANNVYHEASRQRILLHELYEVAIGVPRTGIDADERSVPVVNSIMGPAYGEADRSLHMATLQSGNGLPAHNPNFRGSAGPQFAETDTTSDRQTQRAAPPARPRERAAAAPERQQHRRHDPDAIARIARSPDNLRVDVTGLSGLEGLVTSISQALADLLQFIIPTSTNGSTRLAGAASPGRGNPPETRRVSIRPDATERSKPDQQLARLDEQRPSRPYFRRAADPWDNQGPREGTQVYYKSFGDFIDTVSGSFDRARDDRPQEPAKAEPEPQSVRERLRQRADIHNLDS